jgi:hypothetical protein
LQGNEEICIRMIFQPWTASLGALPKFHLPSNVEETTPWGMSLETLMEEARKLGEQERRRLAVFLTTLRGGRTKLCG